MKGWLYFLHDQINIPKKLSGAHGGRWLPKEGKEERPLKLAIAGEARATGRIGDR